MVHTRSHEEEFFNIALDPKTEPVEAAKTLAKQFRKILAGELKDQSLEDSLDSVWKSIIDTATTLPHESQLPLVELLCAVQKENLSDEYPTESVIWGEKVKVFEELPLFGPAVRSAWNRTPGSGSRHDFSQEQWTNLNGFVARLTSLSPSMPIFDYSLYAIWSLRAAFEEPERHASHVGAAEVWFLYADEIIEKLSQEKKIFEGKLAIPGSKYSGKDWFGFNSERLEIWKKAL